LASEWASIETVAFCEREPFCQKVLRKHWPNTPIYDDVCTLTKERLEADGIGTIGAIFSGDPCQPYSGAGQRKGEADDRFLWPQVNRLVESLRPRWIVRENVAGNITLGLDGVLSDLDDLNYTARTIVLPARAVDADHERYRVFVVANANSESGLQKNKAASAIREKWKAWEDACRRGWRSVPRVDWGVSGPPVSRVSDGVPRELDKRRSIALGNAVVPQQIYPILAAIKQIDDALEANYAR
jgi:DNA (cytosine-5)-methyltransferase 1